MLHAHKFVNGAEDIIQKLPSRAVGAMWVNPAAARDSITKFTTFESRLQHIATGPPWNRSGHSAAPSAPAHW